MDKETRRRNAEARKQRRAALYAEQERDKALVADAMRAVLQDPEASSEQRVFAVAVLDSVEHYNLVPPALKYKGNADALIADFAKRFESFQSIKTE